MCMPMAGGFGSMGLWWTVVPPIEGLAPDGSSSSSLSKVMISASDMVAQLVPDLLV